MARSRRNDQGSFERTAETGRPVPLRGMGLRAACLFAVGAFAALCLASAAQAQGVRYDNILLNAQGTPISGASVAVCTVAADTGTKPCAPLAPIYSDRGLTVPQANPFLTTGIGNYGFFAAPGTYLVQIYGGSLTTHVYTVTLPCDPSASSGCGTASGLSTTGAVSTGTLSVSGNISASGTVSSSAGTAPGVSGTPTTGDCANWASATALGDAGAACGAANAALKPVTGDSVRFVSTNGNDSNDGLSWGTAYKTLYAAWTAAANATTDGGRTGGGTFYVGSGVTCGGPTTGQGLWIAGPAWAQWLAFSNNSNNTVKISTMARASNVVTVTLTAAPPSLFTNGAAIAVYGASDSSFNGTFTITSVGGSSFTYNQTGANASLTSVTVLPAAWVPQLQAHVIGVGSKSVGLNLPSPTVTLGCGSSTGNGIDIRGDNAPMEFDNLQVTGAIGLYLENGVDLTFNDDVFNVDRTFTANGPAAYLTSTSPNGGFWTFFTRCEFQAGGTAAPGDGSNHTEAFVVDPVAPSSVGLIFIRDSFIGGGGNLKINAIGDTASLVVDGLQTESQFDGKGAVWIKPVTTGTTTFVLSNITVSDPFVDPTPAVQTDPASNAGNTLVWNAFGQTVNVSGPATILSQYTNNFGGVTAYPSATGQIGFIAGRTWTQADDARRQFGFVAPRFANLAATLPSGWDITARCTSCTLTTVAAPDGTSNAGQVATTQAVVQVPTFYDQTVAQAVGDYWIVGAWSRSSGANGFPGNAALNFGDIGTGCAVANLNGSTAGTGLQFGGVALPSSVGDGEWDWNSRAFKVTGGTSCEVLFGGEIDSTHTGQFYAPVVLHIAAGTISDNEAAELAAHLASYGNACPVAAACTLPGHDVQIAKHPTQSAANQWAGKVTLSAGSGSFTFPTAFSSAPVCTATDTTAAVAVKASASVTTLTLSGTGTDVIAFVCVGNPN
jgi:hypothetical protein